ncbi:MAG: DUF6290 family protein [Pseudomonadota bacterium]
MTTLTVRISQELDELLQEFCREEDRSKSWILKKALQEKLEDWQDLRDGLKALKNHKKNPNIMSHETLVKELGLTKKDLE